MALPGAARRQRAKAVRAAIADTRAELDALAAHEADQAVARATRGTLHALEDELAALRGGDGPPLGARPTKGWSPRDAWLERASEAAARVLAEHPAALATLAAIERERDERG